MTVGQSNKTSLDFIWDELRALEEGGLYRKPVVIEGFQGPYVTIGGDKHLSFCSNNYLGLAGHPRIKEAAREAIARYGWGAGASRLVSGTSVLHERLEAEIARFKAVEAALVFSTGYMANSGAICALAGRGDLIICDRFNHASILDASRQSGADFRIFAHGDTKALERILSRASNNYKRILIVTDGVFSVDGDIAPLPEIVSIAQRFGPSAMTMVDDAHGTGVFGGGGRGVLEHFGIKGSVDIQMGTLSKALGGIGGFVAGTRGLVDFLKNKSRAFMFTTAIPPAACAAGLEALKLIDGDEGLERRERLWQNCHYLEKGLNASGFGVTVQSPIIPIVLGEPQRVLDASKALFSKKLLVPAIRPPTVPQGTSRLRISLTSDHSIEHLDSLLEGLKVIKQQQGM
ncbi:MAG: 8-amino-7-oxononanoate synthase [Candidatus Brocadiales bacterium]